jgi:hypothetical protein
VNLLDLAALPVLRLTRPRRLDGILDARAALLAALPVARPAAAARDGS